MRIKEIKVTKIKEGTKCLDDNFIRKVGYVYWREPLLVLKDSEVFTQFHQTSLYAWSVIYLRKFHIRKQGKLL